MAIRVKAVAEIVEGVVEPMVARAGDVAVLLSYLPAWNR